MCQTYSKILKEQITPVILDREEESKHQDHVHHGDGDDDHHAAVQGHSVATVLSAPLYPCHLTG